jgi:hypothetical protein
MDARQYDFGRGSTGTRFRIRGGPARGMDAALPPSPSHDEPDGIHCWPDDAAWAELPKNADQVPLFPQDAYLEDPMMAMDKDVDKPETYGLSPGWSGFVGGMMTLVRVMMPAKYDEIMDLKFRQRGQAQEMNPK